MAYRPSFVGWFDVPRDVHSQVLRTLRIRSGTRSPDQLADCTNRVTQNQGCNADETYKINCISGRNARKRLILYLVEFPALGTYPILGYVALETLLGERGTGVRAYIKGAQTPNGVAG